jgi:hypothetical protein
MKTRIAVLFLAALALLVAAPTGASARTATTSVKVNSYLLGFFYGNVRPSDKACRGKRKVTLYTVPKQAGNPALLVGSDKTTKKGKFTINDSHGLGGDYQASVNARTVHKKGKTVTCEAALSPIFSR